MLSDNNNDGEEQSLISVFPTDILSLIFEYTCPTPLFDGRYHRPDTASLRSLSLVSKHWHETLMSTSELWTNIILPMKGDDTQPYATALASFFEKTRYRGLSLSLDFSGLSPFDDGETILLHPSVDAEILENLERVENLQLVKPPEAWFSTFRFLTRVDHLCLYGLGGKQHYPLRLDLLACLSKLTLVDANIRLTTTPPDCIVTSLTLVNVPIDTCFRIFSHCPKLTHLYIEDYDTPDSLPSDPNEVPPSSSQSFPPRPLQNLTWKIFNIRYQASTPWQIAFLNHINPHSLHTLVWHQPSSWIFRSSIHGPQLCSSICNFYTNLSAKLTCLEFVENVDDVWGNESRFVKQLRHGQGVERVGFDGCTVPFIKAVFENIARTSDRELFKALERIRMGKIVWSNPRTAGMDVRLGKMLAESFLEMVRVRVGVKPGEGGVVLWLEDDKVYRDKEGSNCGWVDCIKEEVVEMKRQGCLIEIFVASKPVSWL